MKKTIEDYGKNLDRIKKKLPAEREELSRERIPKKRYQIVSRKSKRCSERVTGQN